jgi:hypothetical protein
MVGYTVSRWLDHFGTAEKIAEIRRSGMGNCKSANTSPLIICVDGSLEGRRADVAVHFLYYLAFDLSRVIFHV